MPGAEATEATEDRAPTGSSLCRREAFGIWGVLLFGDSSTTRVSLMFVNPHVDADPEVRGGGQAFGKSLHWKVFALGVAFLVL